MREFHIKAILGKVADLSDSSVPSSFFFSSGYYLLVACLYHDLHVNRLKNYKLKSGAL